MKKKIMALTLALFMMLSLVPTVAMADTLTLDLSKAVEGVLTITESGTYKLEGITSNLTVKAAEGVNVVFDCVDNAIPSYLSDLTFENVVFKMFDGGEGTNYHGFQHAGTINMINCTINGKFFSYGDMNFTGCTFNAPGTEASGYKTKDYSMWAYSGNITYKNCTFNCAGKCINVYNEGTDSSYTVKVEGCTFNSSVTNKAAFNVKETCVNGKILKFDVQVDTTNKVGEGDDQKNFPGMEITNDGTRTIVINPFVQVDDRLAEGSGEGDQIKVSVGGNELYSSPAAEETSEDAAVETACNIIDAALGDDPSDEAIALAETQKSAIKEAAKEGDFSKLTEVTVKGTEAVEEKVAEDKEQGDKDPTQPTQPTGGLFGGIFSFFANVVNRENAQNIKLVQIIVDFVMQLLNMLSELFN